MAVAAITRHCALGSPSNSAELCCTAGVRRTDLDLGDFCPGHRPSFACLPQAGGAPSPLGEGSNRKQASTLSLGERVSEVRGRVRGSFDSPRKWPPTCYTPPVRIPTKRVRELRRNQTEAEKAAWYLLRGSRLGAKFRRQQRVDNWVADFFCFEHRLAIELDGGVHSQFSRMRNDAAKEDYFRTVGIRLLRIPNRMGLEDPEGFMRVVREACAKTQPVTDVP